MGARVPPRDSGTTVSTPDLTGDWTGTFKNYVAGEGYGNGTGYTIIMSVADQQDRIFSGTLYITNSTQAIVYHQAFAGAVGPDGKTLTIVQSDGSYTTGTYTAPDQVELIYALSGENYDVAIDTLKKT